MHSLVIAIFSAAAFLSVNSSAFAQSVQPAPGLTPADSISAIPNGYAGGKISVGNLVQLGPLMTVTAIEGDNAICQWQDPYSTKQYTARFPIAKLTVVKAAASSQPSSEYTTSYSEPGRYHPCPASVELANGRNVCLGY
jgi:hypothetical protein